MKNEIGINALITLRREEGKYHMIKLLSKLNIQVKLNVKGP